MRSLIASCVILALVCLSVRSQRMSVTFGDWNQQEFFRSLVSKFVKISTCEECRPFEKTISSTGMIGLIYAQMNKDKVCKMLMDMLKITIIDQKECVHLLGQMNNLPQVLLKKLFNQNEGYLCYVLLGYCPASQSSISYFDSQAYISQILTSPRNSQTLGRVRSGMPSLKILHLSDAHIKLKYVQDASSDAKWRWAACENAATSASESRAGMFGDPRCDAPTQLFEAFLTFAKGLNPDIIVYTGDNNDHNMMNYQNYNKFAETEFIAKRLRETFPTATILPTLGNIETAPQDHQYDHITRSLDWALAGVAKAYSPLLTSEQTQSLAKNGFYSSELLDYNLRVISLFSGLFDATNFFMAARTFNPNGIFDFISSNLQQAESKGQRVIFISHIPAGSDMHSQFSRIMSAFVERYSHLIIGHFAGHNHRDSLAFYSKQSDPLAVTAPVLSVASLSPIGGSTPSFRLWQYDLTAQQLVDYTQYSFDLQRANSLKNGDQWSESYRFREVYKLEDASLLSFQKLRDNLRTNSDFATSTYIGLRNAYKPAQVNYDEATLASLNCGFEADSKVIADCLKVRSPSTQMSISNILSIIYPDFLIMK